MLVSFYIQISIIGMSFVLMLLPFLGLPQSFDKALTAVLGTLIFGVSAYALYQGYVRILKREEKRLEHNKEKHEKPTPESAAFVEEEIRVHSTSKNDEFKSYDHARLHIVRD
ncbi:MAG: hypothetical protein WDZ74_00275 [Candidatus Paceibacterota bacterium]